MKKLIFLALVALPLALTVGCSSSDDPAPPPTPPSDATVLQRGWTAFEAADYAEAESQFRELLNRNRLLAEAHDGLGWTFARQSGADSSLTHFAAALAAGADALPIADQTYAGLAFARHADQEYASCLTAAAEVSSGWVFAHGSDLDRDDITLLEAMAHYALGQFEDALAKVQELDSQFTADVGTVEGRAALAAKIEALQG